MKPIAFKVRTQGHYDGTKGGKVKAGGGGCGALWYEDKTFTVATHQDQWVAVPLDLRNDYTYPTQAMTQPATNPIRFLSVCSGMEAASVAWEPLGFKAVGFSEIEPFPCAVLKHRFPNTPNYGDLTKYAEWPLEPGSVDLLVGGTPCQSFSVAGLRKGLADPRGNLALVFLGLVDKLRPRWVVWENVPGVLSSSGGRDFASFLGALGQLGYGWSYRVLDAQHFGVPQRRRRVFVVATSSGDGRLAGEVLSLPEGLRGYLASRKQKGKGAASDAGAGAEADGLQRTVGTLCADTHPGAYSGQDAYTGRLIPCPDNDSVGALCARDYKGVGSQYVSEGKCIPYRKSKRPASDKDDEVGVLANSANTLNNFDLGDTRTTHAVVEPIAIQGTIIGRGENAGPQGVGATEGGPMFTLTKTDIHGVAQPIPIQDGREIEKRQNGMGVGNPGDPAYTVDTTGAQAVGTDCYNGAITGDVAATMGTSGSYVNAAGPTVMQPVAQPINIYGGNKRADRPNGGMYVRQEDISKCLDAANGLNPTCSQGGTAVIMPMAVRRLTPVECERLQGFPDNWSRIPWKGKPETECPDGPRYKACGNSMAVPVMRWIGKRIQEVEGKGK